MIITFKSPQKRSQLFQMSKSHKGKPTHAHTLKHITATATVAM